MQNNSSIQVCSSKSVNCKESNRQNVNRSNNYQQIKSFIMRRNVFDAQILLALEIATSNYSVNSSEKCAYVINFGLAPYFINLLVLKLTESPMFSVAFNEGHN